MLKYRKILLVLIGILLVVFGYFRQFFYKNINQRLWELWANDNESILHPSLDYLKSWEYWDLYYLKWLLAALFIIIFWSLSSMFLYLYFKDKKYSAYITWLFGILIGLIVLFYGGGYLLGIPMDGYKFSMQLLHFLHSPLPLFISIPFFTLINVKK